MALRFWEQAKGYEERDYAESPEFGELAEYSGRKWARDEWKDRIDEQNEERISAYHWHKAYVPIKSQGSWGYCWAYGTVCAVETAYAMQGVDTGSLNAHALAYRGKSGRNRGGYGLEACRYITEFGIPSERVLAGKVRTTRWSDDVQRNADQHKLVNFEEVGKDNFDGVINSLLNGHPTTLALRWWRHLVCGVGVAYKGNDFGIIIANSHGTRYSAGGMKDGYGVLWGRKAVPFEAVSVRSVKVRSE